MAVAGNEIIRSESIVVSTVTTDKFGNLNFTDTANNTYRISSKRVLYFKDTIISGKQVELDYAMSSFGKEYIYSAREIKAEQKVVTPPAEKKVVDAEIKEDNLPRVGWPGETPMRRSTTIKEQPSGQEIGMWWKELGEMIRAGKAPEDMTPYYWREMLEVLGIDFTLSPYELPAKQVKPLETQRSDNQTDKDLLIGLVMNHLKYTDAKTAINWLTSVQKIPMKRIDEEPRLVAKELIEKMGWN